ncbi:histidine kinase [Ferruginibacter yonginensis]|uniref:Histidine kinase n=1 Tax=Ferruginibacter yonginensis TaxID=1310416 RepID=A0ABV8QQQ6_9BACT
MKRRTRYWLCQLIGWGSWVLLQVFIAYQFAPEAYLTPALKRNLFFYSVFCDFISFILITHLIRYILKKMKWMSFSADKIFLMFIAAVLIGSTVSFYFQESITKIPGNTFERYEINERKDKAAQLEKDLGVANTTYYLFENNGKLDSTKYVAYTRIKKSTGWYRDKNNQWQFEEQRKGRNFGGIFFNTILISIWLLIYLVWHYVDKNRNDQLDKLRLEGVVKSLELKTIKSHINPHFIFNALNSIRALVDENPERARTAITELSNILRSSLKAETLETVPLQQELDIVRDYLALEHMRFEERLQIEMDIHPDTLTQPIPPMMLQTLVENAIKHGISKSENGGIIKISSYFKNNHHELIVLNTGNLTSLKTKADEGFGLKSTQDRLNLLYNKKAQFEINETENNMVQSKVIMPIVAIL